MPELAQRIAPPQDPKDLKIPVLLLGVQNDPIVGNEGVAAVAATVINAGAAEPARDVAGHRPRRQHLLAVRAAAGASATSTRGKLPGTDTYCPA